MSARNWNWPVIIAVAVICASGLASIFVLIDWVAS